MTIHQSPLSSSLNESNNTEMATPPALIRTQRFSLIFPRIPKIPIIQENRFNNNQRKEKQASNEKVVISLSSNYNNTNEKKNLPSISSIPSIDSLTMLKSNNSLNFLATASLPQSSTSIQKLSSKASSNKTITFFNPITHSILAVPLIISAESTSPSLSQSPSNSSASVGSLPATKVVPARVASKAYEKPDFLKDQCVEIHKLDSGAYSAIG